MKSHPTPQDVLDGLGDKVVNGLSVAIDGARADLDVYRRALPGFVADASKRGLANWLHDRLIARARVELDGVPGVSISDREPYRDIVVGVKYRLRAKKHSALGMVATYPTAGAMDFFTQPATLFTELGLDEVRLVVGYEWDDVLAVMGRAVLSLHDGYGEPPIWMIDLPPAQASAGAGTVVTVPPTVTPSSPRINVSPEIGDQREETKNE